MPFEIDGLAPLFQVFDLPTSIAFYQSLLGFEVIESTDDWALLKRDAIELMLNTAYERPDRPDEPDRVRQAAHADTTLYFGCPDPDAAFEYLTAKGLKLQRPVIAPYGMKQLTVTDPDGYLLCFQWPTSNRVT